MSIPIAEVVSVVFAAFAVWVSALIQHLSNTTKRGPGYVMSNRSTPPEMEGFFGRATRTLSNNIESALMYIPPVLVVVASGSAAGLSHYTAWIYILTRLLFSLSYWFGVRVVRSIAWLIGMVCCAIMYYVALSPMVLR
jgi:uncharacterized MAPEG superfamily protein